MTSTIILFITLAILGVIAFFYFKKQHAPVEESIEDTLTALSEQEQKLFDLAIHPESAPHTFIYALTTCNHCRRTKALLEENNVPFSIINIDSYPKLLNKELADKVREYNPRGSFPTIRLTNGQIITGYRENSLKEALINDPNRTS